MASLTGTFTAANTVSYDLRVPPHESATIILTRTGSGAFSVALDERVSGDQYAPARAAFTADTAGTAYLNDTDFPKYLRLRCSAIVGGDSIAYTLEDATGEALPDAEWFNAAGTRVLAVTDTGIATPHVAATTAAITTMTGATVGTHTGLVVPPSGLGTAGTGVTAVEQGVGGFRFVTLTLTNVILPIVSVTTGNGVGGVTLFTAPEGYIYTLGCVAALTWEVPTADEADYTDGTPEGQLGIGTLAPANADALGTDATDDSLSTAADITGTDFAGEVNLASEAPLAYDGSATAMPVVLTGLIDAADIDNDVTSSILVSGTVTLTYIHRGDVTAI
jgi:hypothetical protein